MNQRESKASTNSQLSSDSSVILPSTQCCTLYAVCCSLTAMHTARFCAPFKALGCWWWPLTNGLLGDLTQATSPKPHSLNFPPINFPPSSPPFLMLLSSLNRWDCYLFFVMFPWIPHHYFLSRCPPFCQPSPPMMECAPPLCSSASPAPTHTTVEFPMYPHQHPLLQNIQLKKGER